MYTPKDTYVVLDRAQLEKALATIDGTEKPHPIKDIVLVCGTNAITASEAVLDFARTPECDGNFATILPNMPADAEWSGEKDAMDSMVSAGLVKISEGRRKENPLDKLRELRAAAESAEDLEDIVDVLGDLRAFVNLPGSPKLPSELLQELDFIEREVAMAKQSLPLNTPITPLDTKPEEVKEKGAGPGELKSRQLQFLSTAFGRAIAASSSESPADLMETIDAIAVEGKMLGLDLVTSKELRMFLEPWTGCTSGENVLGGDVHEG